MVLKVYVGTGSKFFHQMTRVNTDWLKLFTHARFTGTKNHTNATTCAASKAENVALNASARPMPPNTNASTAAKPKKQLASI
jgi:hypothetical protein